MQQSPINKQALMLAAIAHPNRIRIVEELRDGVRCNCELMPILKLEQSNLSRHLKILVQAGVLISWKEGLRVNFKVAHQEIFTILDLARSTARKYHRVPVPA
jgi:DNA-binding transcriptional ArsR family regulator